MLPSDEMKKNFALANMTANVFFRHVTLIVGDDAAVARTDALFLLF